MADFGALGTATVDVKADLSSLDRSVAALPSKFAAAGSQIDAGMAGVRHSTRNTAFAFLELSRAVEDAQYGLAGVVNNIPGLVAALGGGAGVAAVASIAAVAINQLVKHWDDISALWKSDETLREAERMKKLAEYTKRVADESERIAKHKGSAIDERASAVEAGHRDVGHAQAVADVAAAIEASGRGGTKEMNEKNAADILARAVLGDKAALDWLDELLSGAAGKFGSSKLARAIEDPGGKKAADAAQKDAQEAQRRRDEVRKEQERKDKEAFDLMGEDFNAAKKANEKDAKDRKAKDKEAFEMMNDDFNDAKRERGRAEMLGTSSYLSRLATAGQNSDSSPVVQQQKLTNKQLEKIERAILKQHGRMGHPKWQKNARLSMEGPD